MWTHKKFRENIEKSEKTLLLWFHATQKENKMTRKNNSKKICKKKKVRKENEIVRYTYNYRKALQMGVKNGQASWRINWI